MESWSWSKELLLCVEEEVLLLVGKEEGSYRCWEEGGWRSIALFTNWRGAG